MSGNITCVYLSADNVRNIYVNENIRAISLQINHCQPENVDQHVVLDVTDQRRIQDSP